MATIRVGETVGFDRVARLWRKIGVGKAPQAYPSIALGVFELTPLEVAQAYTVFTNNGAVRSLTPLDHILANGHELEGFLRLIASVVAAQHAALSGLPPGSLPGPAQIAKARLVKQAPLDPKSLPRDPSWRAALTRILAEVDGKLLPDPARAARAALGACANHTMQ